MEGRHSPRAQFWILTIAAASILAITMGLRASLGLFISPLNTASGLGIVTISFALAINHLMWGAWQPVFGALADRFGPNVVIVLGGILTMAATSDTRLQGTLLLVGYTAGLGIPFILIAAFYDRVRGLTRFLVRHGRAVSLVGGLLVVAIGIAMMFDWLVLLPRWFQFVSFV